MARRARPEAVATLDDVTQAATSLRAPPATSRRERRENRRRRFTRTETRRPRAPRRLPAPNALTLVPPLVVCAVALVVLRGELIPARNLNDGAMHMSMVRWAVGVLHSGRLPLDGWFPRLGLGFAQFHHYQSLPHIVTALISNASGRTGAYSVVQYVLLGTLPLSAWFGARLFGIGRIGALWCAALVLLPVSTTNYGNELGSYVWRGYGMYPQLWGVWLLPITLAVSWRAVDEGRRPVLAGILLGLTVLCHAIVGYLAGVAVIAWILVRPRHLHHRIGRALLIGAATLCTTAWFLLPLFRDRSGATYGGYERHTFWYDSYGARKVLGWLVSGRIYDQGRAPVLTALVGVGVAVTAWCARREVLARALLAFWVVSIVLFCGRPTFGPLLDRLPGSQDMFFPRFLVGVHIGGVLLAGYGLGRLTSVIVSTVRSRVEWRPGLLAAAAIAAVAVVAVVPGWRERDRFEAQGAQWMREQRVADQTSGADVIALAAHARASGGGRVYAGTTFNWGQSYRVGDVPVHTLLLGEGFDTLGNLLRVSSLSTGLEAKFDERDIRQYELFDVRYVILPVGRRPAVPARFLEQRGAQTLWSVDTPGYLSVVDSTPALFSTTQQLASNTTWFLTSDLLAHGRYPTLDIPGAPVGSGTTTEAAPLNGPAGRFEWQYADPDTGLFSGQFVADRDAYVLLRQSWHPRWTATVDGHAVHPVPIAPSFVAVRVSPGRHFVVLRYSPWRTEWLLVAGVIGLVVLQLVLVWRRRQRTVTPRVEDGYAGNGPRPPTLDALGGDAAAG